jgi:hypothetical protein
MKHFISQNCAQLLKTNAHWIHKIKWFTFRMLILGKKSCFLKLTIFEIPQSKSNSLLCLAMAMNSGLLCPRWLYLHSQCAASDCEPRAATNATAVHASSRWAYSGGGLYGTSAACGVYGSQLFVLKATECQIQHPNVKVLAAFLFACIFPFLLLFFIWLSEKGLHYVNFIGFSKSYSRDLDLSQS